MRPSGSACHQRPGKLLIARLAPASNSLLRPLGDPVARNVHVRAPEIRRRALPCASAPPGTRAAPASASQTCGRNVARWPPNARTRPSLAGPKPRQEILFVADVEALGGRQQRHLDRRAPRTPRAASGGKRGSRNAAASAFSRTSTPSGRRGSSEPMQPRSSPVVPQRHERGRRCFASAAWLTSGDRRQPELARRSPSARSSAARGRDHGRPWQRSRRSQTRTTRNRRRATCRRPCRRSCAGRGARGRSPRRRAASRRPLIGVAPHACVVIERGGQREDRVAGRAVDPARVGIPVIVRQVGADDDQRLRPAPQQIR